MGQQIALVGIGKIARDQHVPALAASAAWHMAATVSRHGTVPGVPGYTDMSEMLAAHPEVAAVSLALPPVPRYGAARAALEAGRHVMLEKPPGATLAEVQDLAALAETRGLTLFATWHSRMGPGVAAARDWLAGQDLRRVAITWREDVRRWHPGQDWVFEPGGMGVFDPGINALSVLTAILPRAVFLRAAQLWVPENRQTPIAADLVFEDPGGAEVVAQFDWRETGPQIWDIALETAQGAALLTEGGARFLVAGAEQRPPPGAALAGEYPALYDRMAELVATGTSEVDLTPMIHVADALSLGRRETVAAFHF